MKGKVYLVGAGPGDPDLLTLRALRVLCQADVVLHDALVASQILELIPSKVMVLNVGKRCGSKAITQEQINRMLVSFSAAGTQRSLDHQSQNGNMLRAAGCVVRNVYRCRGTAHHERTKQEVDRTTLARRQRVGAEGRQEEFILWCTAAQGQGNVTD